MTVIAHTPHPITLVDDLFVHARRSFPVPLSLVIITDENVMPLCQPLYEQLCSSGHHCHMITIPAGEKSKSWETYLAIQKQLIDKQCSAHTLCLAIGGGVVLDLAGFVAATYCRGIPLILIPTTLLAMIDASIGGKNGINLHSIKNKIGSFYLPQDVWLCLSFLESLPDKEKRQGIAEAIKHAYVMTPALLPFLYDLNLFSSAGLKDFILMNCRMKADLTHRDPKDQGVRKILNFGHTIGHALETLSQGSLSHGEAISIGMAMELHCSIQKEIADIALLERLCFLLQIWHLPTTPTDLPFSYSPDLLFHAMTHDKKNLSYERISLVMVKDIGVVQHCQGTYCHTIDKQEFFTCFAQPFKPLPS